MKTLSRALPTCLTDLGIALSALLLVGAGGQSRVESLPLRAYIEGIPTPRQMVRSAGESTYVVPQDRILTVTGVARIDPSVEIPVHVRIDGEPICLVDLDGRGPFASGVASLPVGLAARPGSTVRLTDARTGAGAEGLVLLGYLEGVNPERKGSVGGIPAPRQMVQVFEGEALTIPRRHYLVVTGVSSLDPDAARDVALQFDGAVQAVFAPGRHGGVLSIPAGFAARAGTIVGVRTRATEPHPPAVIYGYLQSF